MTTADTVLDLIRNAFPPNLVEASISQYSTVLLPPKDNPEEEDIYKWTIKGSYGNGTNIIGIVVFSIILGIVVGKMGPSGKPLLEFFSSLSDASMKMTSLVIKCTPVGVLFLILPRVIDVEDLNTMLGGVGLYTLTVLLGLFIHGFVVLPCLYLIVVRKNPYKMVAKMSGALMTAFGTSSSSATLPVTIAALEKHAKIDSRIVRFLVPVGATINMDGTALYEAVAAIFIAQSRGVPLGIVKIIIISVTATAASVGAAGIPQAGLVTMVIVLNAVGLPAEDVALIFVVDWFLDRFRTLINVLGDSFGAAIVEHLCQKDLESLPPTPVKKDELNSNYMERVAVLPSLGGGSVLNGPEPVYKL
jgi:Na+/H+-dicarboxylate symporter